LAPSYFGPDSQYKAGISVMRQTTKRTGAHWIDKILFWGLWEKLCVQYVLFECNELVWYALARISWCGLAHGWHCNLLWRLVWISSLMHKCVCIWRYVLQNYNYNLHFQNLFIYHIPHVSIGTLGTENLDVCTTCDPWNSNIQLITEDNKYIPMLFNVWPWFLLIVIAIGTRTGNWRRCKTNSQLVSKMDMMMFPVMISGSMTCWSNLLIINTLGRAWLS
jgi:hypothetical protein